MNGTLLHLVLLLGIYLHQTLATTDELTELPSTETNNFPQYPWSQPNLDYQWYQGGGMAENGGYSTGGDYGYMEKSWKRFMAVENCTEGIFAAFGSRKDINLSWECCSVISAVGPGCFAETIGSFDDDEFSDLIVEHCGRQVAPPPVARRLDEEFAMV